MVMMILSNVTAQLTAQYVHTHTPSTLDILLCTLPSGTDPS